MSSAPLEAAAAENAPLRHLLVGYDGSEAAATACAFALWLAGKTGADATLLHVTPDLADAAARPTAQGRLDEDLNWRRRLDDVRSSAGEGATVETDVVRGHPAAALLDAARTREADLLLVGSTGASAARRVFPGSVSSQIVDHAPCPVMVFPAGHQAPPAQVRSVVVGVDGSERSLEALAMAQQLARPLGAKLVLAHAYEPGVPSDIPTTELREDLRASGAEVLRSARRHVSPDVEVVEELVEGQVRRHLVGACESHRPAIIAVGSRGLGGFAGLLLGSTSRWVLHHAACPVLVAHRRQPLPGRSS
jgi:nucleotide-binding universal stress UspA family protein